MKKRILFSATVVLLTTLSVVFLACEDDEDNAELGKNAAIEFCDCLDNGNSRSDCEDKLKDKYSFSEYMSEDFLKAFNEQGTECGIKMTKID